MLPKKYKLKSNIAITQIFKNGKTVKSSFLFLKYRLVQPEKITQTAFSIGLKYSKRAVDRNQAKRILRITLDELTNQIKPGFDLVFYFDKNFKEKLEKKTIQELMKSCLYQAKLLK